MTNSLVSLLSLSTALTAWRPFDTGEGAPQGPSWKMTDDGIPELRDGNPVYIAPDGSENVFNIQTLPKLNAEARSHRERAQTLQEQLKGYEGIDPAAAREAMQRVQDMGDKEMIDKGEIEKVRARVSEEWGKKLSTAEERAQKLESQIQTLVSDNAFASSKFVQERLAVPADMAQAVFGKHFKYEDGQLQAYGKDGQKLYSAKNPNAEITFDEAIEMLVADYPHRDKILAAPDHGEGGSGGSGGGNRGGGRVMRRSEFEKLHPQEQAARSREMAEGKLVITD